MTLELADLAAIAAILAGPIAVQTFWISRSIGRVETTLDAFKTEVHHDMATHTEAITDLRERVARLEA